MVHALRRAGGRLRRGGMLISIRPHRTWRPAVAILTKRRRIPVAQLLNPAFEANLRSADSALQRVVRDGRFSLVGEKTARYRSYLQRPSQMRTYLELINPPRPRFPPGGRARLFALWDAAPPGSRIEITEAFVLTVLRRR